MGGLYVGLYGEVRRTILWKDNIVAVGKRTVYGRGYIKEGINGGVFIKCRKVYDGRYCIRGRKPWGKGGGEGE